jgi:signal transduction histidine kinase
VSQDWLSASGETEVQVVQTDLDALLKAAVHDLDPLIQQHRSTVRLQQSQVGTVPVDPDRFKQLLVILVDNALRHSPSGTRIEVSCLRRDHELVLEVADHGPGILARERQQVFERFHRLPSSQRHAGSGLGLAIARWSVAAHGGNLTLDDNHPGLRAPGDIPDCRLRTASPPEGSTASAGARGTGVLSTPVRAGRSRVRRSRGATVPLS